MEIKSCVGCRKEIKREKVWNNWKTYKIDISDKQWERKKFCSRNCSNNHHARKRYKNDPKLREYRRNWFKNVSKEKRKGYYEKHKPIKKKYLERLKKENPELLEKWKENYLKSIRKERNKIFERYDNKCAICGFSKVLDIHHIDKRRHKRGNSVMDYKKNRVIVLCPNCHVSYHRGILSKEELLKEYKPIILNEGIWI